MLSLQEPITLLVAIWTLESPTYDAARDRNQILPNVTLNN
jgi:hypothetical protein